MHKFECLNTEIFFLLYLSKKELKYFEKFSQLYRASWYYSLLFIQLMHNWIALKMLKFTLKFTWEMLLHVSVFHNHHQGATICALIKL